MNRTSVQLGLVAAALVILGIVGMAGRDRSGSPVQPLAGGVAAAATMPPTADSPTTSLPPSTTTTTAPTTTTTEVPPARELEIQVFPADVEAATWMTDQAADDGEERETSAGAFTGPVEVRVEADGYRSENMEIPADRDGVVEVWLDPSDQVVDLVTVFDTGSAPKQVAFTPDSAELWVTLLGGSGLEAYDPVTGDLIAGIDLPEAGSVEVIFDRAGDRAYVSQMETASVYEIDVATHRVVRRLQTEGSWTKVMVLSPDEDTLWASNWVSNDVSEFDLATGEMVRRFPTVTTPRGLAVDPAGTKLYIAGYDSGDIETFDLETGENTAIFDSGGAMRHMVADPDAGLIYASDMAKDSVFVIDMATDEVTTLGSTNRLPNTIDLTPDGRVLAVSNRGRNNPESYYLPGPEWGSVLLLDAETGEILDAIVGGNQPTGLDISTDGRWLAFSDFLDNRVSVFSMPPTQELMAAGGGRGESHRAELTK